jgi:hypothetical protein
VVVSLALCRLPNAMLFRVQALSFLILISEKREGKRSQSTYLRVWMETQSKPAMKKLWVQFVANLLAFSPVLSISCSYFNIRSKVVYVGEVGVGGVV